MKAERKRLADRSVLRTALAALASASVACSPVPETVDGEVEDQVPALGADAPLDGLNNDGGIPTMGNPLDAAASPEENAESEESRQTEEGEDEVDSLDDAASASLPDAEDADPSRISDEQDFDAVSNRQTIESDAARLKARREAYLEIRYGELPKRGDATVPNIVEFALSTGNSVGEQIWPRIRVVSEETHTRNCARFANDNFAQEAFLANGGPKRNWRSLDPDGDGFACGWDPTPFRDSVALGR